MVKPSAFFIALAILCILSLPSHSFAVSTPSSAPAVTSDQPNNRSLILIGFLGGNIRGNDTLRLEARLVQQLQQKYPSNVHAYMFANSDGSRALDTILKLLGPGVGSTKNQGLTLTPQEKANARIVIFGHSWGASETVALADRLNLLGIPVLLTVQVDSVQKLGENDWRIPPNVAEAANFYQSEGLLSGRSAIVPADPRQTTILGNYQSTYKANPVSIAGFPWYARLFMRQHIEIENDPAIWAKVEALIQSKIL